MHAAGRDTLCEGGSDNLVGAAWLLVLGGGFSRVRQSEPLLLRPVGHSGCPTHRLSLGFHACPGQQQFPSVSSFRTCPAGQPGGDMVAPMQRGIDPLNLWQASFQQSSQGFSAVAGMLASANATKVPSFDFIWLLPLP